MTQVAIHGSRRTSNLVFGLRLAAICVFSFLAVSVASTKKSPANFEDQVARTFVEIDGVDYGAFDIVSGLEDNAPKITFGGRSYTRVALKRDFVTEPSLYLWAKDASGDRGGLKDVQLVMENREGEELARVALRLCQPLSWTVEASNPATGGFHEAVDLAVHSIELQ